MFVYLGHVVIVFVCLGSMILPNYQSVMRNKIYNYSARLLMWWRGNEVGARKHTFCCSPRTWCAGEETGARKLKRAAPVARKEQFISFF